MKILQINAVNKIGSTGRNIEELAVEVRKQGHEVFNVHSVGPVDAFSYIIGNKFEHKLHSLLSRILGKQAYFSQHSTKKLLRFLDSYSPDIVHLNNLHSNYINLPILLVYLAQKNIATVVTLHDCWFFTGKCMHYTAEECYKWQEECGHCPQLKEGNRSWFFDKTTKMLNDKRELFNAIPRLAVVGVSDWITNEARKSILKDAKIIKRIYNWIDLDLFKPVDTKILRKKLELNGRFVILGVASGWSNLKGLDLFIQLSSKIDGNMVIVLVGNIPRTINFPPNIISVGTTNNLDELVEYYSMADVFVNFSKEETFGKVAAEALACGTPVITNQYTANPELVVDGCGYVINDCSLDDTRSAIITICNDGKAHYTEKCFSFSKSFEKEKIISEYLNLYKEIIG